jgi:hypothetical protein
MFRRFGGKDWLYLQTDYGLKWMLKSCIALIHAWYPNKRRVKGDVPCSVLSYTPWVRHTRACMMCGAYWTHRVMRENAMWYGVGHVTSDGQLASRSSCKPNLRAYDEIQSTFKIYLIVVLGFSHWRVCFFEKSHNAGHSWCFERFSKRQETQLKYSVIEWSEVRSLQVRKKCFVLLSDLLIPQEAVVPRCWLPCLRQWALSVARM